MFKIHGIKFSKDLVKIIIKILDNLVFVWPLTPEAGAVPVCLWILFPLSGLSGRGCT